MRVPCSRALKGLALIMISGQDRAFKKGMFRAVQLSKMFFGGCVIDKKRIGETL